MCAYWSWLLCSIFLEPTTAHRSSSYRSSGSFGGFTPHFTQAAVTTCSAGNLASKACKGKFCGPPQDSFASGCTLQESFAAQLRTWNP